MEKATKTLIAFTALAWIATAIMLDKQPNAILVACIIVQTGLILFNLRLLRKIRNL